MVYETSSKPVSALHEILKWSASCPEWQRDALRRIVTKETIDEGDRKEWNRLCRAKHKADVTTEPLIKAEPLAEGHLPPGPGSDVAVSLVSIGNLQHVNRLSSNQTIPFGPVPGLTIIYGDNGSGKSGYARVIKKACRARGVPPVIRPDAFAKAASTVASAHIVCRVATADVPVAWQDDIATDPRLANVFVFDSFSAGHYLREDSPAAFTPYGLDVLPALSQECDLLRDRIKQDIDATSTSISVTAMNWKFIPSTAVGKLIENLSTRTKSADVDVLAGLDIQQAQRLKDLQQALKSDPKQKAKETRAAAARLRVFATKIKTITETLSVESIRTLQKLAGNANTTAEAAKVFAAGLFDGGYLPGTGRDHWRKMWDAAVSFSVSEAYKEQPFPVTAPGSRCVLCQQDLEEEAVARLEAFDSFCKDKSQQLAADAAKQLKGEADKIAKTERLAPELDKVEAEIALMKLEERQLVKEFIKRADECLMTIKDNLAKGTWTSPAAVPPTPVSLITALETRLEERAKTEESADDPQMRKKMENERDELDAREWLSGVKADVLAQIEKYNYLEKLKKCLKDTSTSKITGKSTDLTKLLVTDAFCEQFKKETQALGLRTLDVKLEGIKGKKGETKFGLRLATPTDHKVVEIASEGEQRCIALAAFLAELSQASHQSSLVFDDPVSSLDHWHREKIAARLAEESKIRQVIVFTHDSVFLNDLQSYAFKGNLTSEIFHLEWIGNTPGCCVKGLPWDLKSADDRFDKLEKEQRSIAKSWNPIPNEENILSIRRAYSWLRATLERIVEKEVFADVIFRFRSYVDIKKLDGVIGFTGTECKELQRLVQRCHDITDAHDPAQAKHSAIPEPADLAKDIADAKQLLTTIRIRRKGITAKALPAKHKGSC